MKSKKKIVLQLEEDEFRALERLSEKFQFTPSQMVKYVLLGELGLPRDNLIPLMALEKRLEDYVGALRSGDTFYGASALGSDWWDLNTEAKRVLAWRLKKLEEQGVCKKTGKTLSNGTNQYMKV